MGWGVVYMVQRPMQACRLWGMLASGCSWN